jgi:hypothetical protein
MTAPAAVTCPYCLNPARFMKSSEVIYRGRDYGPVFACLPCEAWVGCHPDLRPLGRLANGPLRLAKRRAHLHFDPLWREWRSAYPPGERISKRVQNVARARAYQWLAEQLGIPVDDTHIGMFDENTCERAILVIISARPTPTSIRAWAKARKAAA